LTKRRKRD